MLPSHVVTAARRFRTADVRRVGRRTRRPGERTARERGAVLVHAAVAMTGLLAFSALTIDLGTVWVARAQAQNAVDAAALAGAVSLAYVDPSNLDAAVASARAIGQTHAIWGDPIAPGLMTVTAGSCPAGAPSITGSCLNVAVERGGAAGAPLPVFFSRIFGGTPTRMRASASAKVMLGNSSTCVRPFAIPDRWTETSGPWTFDSIFERYQPGSPGALVPNPDSYDPPGPGGTGTGHDRTELMNQEIQIVRGPIDVPVVRGRTMYSLDLPRTGGDGLTVRERYEENVVSCAGEPVSIGQTVYTAYSHQEWTQDSVNVLFDRDAGARWDGTKIVDSAFTVSPRIVPIVLYDPDEFSQRLPSPAEEYRAPMIVRNIVGLFITERVDGGTITGIVVPLPGAFDQRSTLLTQDASFLHSVALVR